MMKKNRKGDNKKKEKRKKKKDELKMRQRGNERDIRYSETL